MKIIILLSTLLVVCALNADQHSDENRLLKSWGFQFNAQGLLVFKSENKKQPEYQLWSPEQLNYQLTESEKNPAITLQPVVISSRNKSEN